MTSFKPLWAFLVLVLVAAIFMLSPYGQKALMAADEGVAEVVAMADADPVADTEAEAVATEKVVSTAAATPKADAEDGAYALTSPEHVLAARTMGDPNAPVKLQEFASLSCPHCAHFHTDIFPKIKEAYIDTGKVYFTFTDFPLNASALEGTLITRCLPEGRYFKFLSFLFEKQADWAFGPNYQDFLRQNSRLLGLSSDDADKCLSDPALRGGIVETMQELGEKHSIDSTPSFVLNDTQVIKGAQSFENFSKAIDALLEEKSKTE